MARRREPEGPDLFDALRDAERLAYMQELSERKPKSASEVLREYKESVEAAAKSAPVIHRDPE